MTKVTLKEVAQAAGVHTSTASRALDSAKSALVNPETRERVQSAARDLGYRVDGLAASLRRGRTNTFGVVVADLGNPFIAPVLRGIENALGGRGIIPMVAESRDSSSRLAQVCDAMIARRVDALITTAGRRGDEAVLRRVAEHVPLVTAVRTLASLGVPQVSHDDVAGGRMAAVHLLDLGHRRLGQVVGPSDISSFHGRGTGFRDAAAAAGASVVEVEDAQPLPTIDKGRRLMEELLALPEVERPTAVFAHNDTMALGVIDALRTAGLRCPEDVSVVGYNDAALTEFTAPPLTTVRLPGYEIGRGAADLASGLLEEPSMRGHSSTLQPTLVVRSSTAPPASRA